MNYTTLEVGNVTYKLRLTTRQIVALEKALGCNPFQIIYQMDKDILPKFTDMVIILHSMLQPLNHGISLDNVYSILDDYFAEGHGMFDLIPIFVEVFKESGFINTDETDEEADPN